MTEERQDLNPQDAAAPRWIGIVVVALAVVSLVALGAGWTASTRSKALEQSLADQNTADPSRLTTCLRSVWRRPRTPTRSFRAS